jgi:hypothetical protein
MAMPVIVGQRMTVQMQMRRFVMLMPVHMPTLPD